MRTNNGDGLGPEERPGLSGGAAVIGPVDLSRGLLRVAAIPANEEVLDAALRLVVALARVTVTGASASAAMAR
jgi:hypothetical protein